MAFEGLTEKLSAAFKKIRSKGKLSEADVKEAMREVRLALLEADVNYKVAKDFTNNLTEKAIGERVMESLTPAQMVIKIVNEELTELMGGTGSKLTYSPKGFTVYLMVGLQGTGKTTTCGKLAAYLKKNGKKPMLCGKNYSCATASGSALATSTIRRYKNRWMQSARGWQKELRV